MTLKESGALRTTRGERRSENPRSTTDGFILLESLIAMAMVSILAVSSLTLIDSVSQVYRVQNSDRFLELNLRLSANPGLHQTHGRLRLESTRSLDTGGTWRLYVFRTANGRDVEFPIYVAPKN